MLIRSWTTILICQYLVKVEGFGIITLVGNWEVDFSIQAEGF